MTALSRTLIVSNGNVTGIVERLVADGLVVRLSTRRDRRATFVRLTRAGRAPASPTMAAVHERWIDELSARSSRAPRPSMIDALERLDQQRAARWRSDMSRSRPKHFNWRMDGAVAVVTLTRPERKNPLTFDSYAELRDTFQELARHGDLGRSVKAVVFGSNGGNFCSGGDVHDIIGPLLDKDMVGPAAVHAHDRRSRQGHPQVPAAGDRRHRRHLRRRRRHGRARGRHAPRHASAKTAFLFTRVGLAGCDMGACAMLPRVIGQGRAAELLFTGRTMSADEGERWGFLQPHCRGRQARSATRSSSPHDLADGPTFAHMMTKTMLDQEWSMTVDQAIEAEAQAQAICMQTRDFRRAYDAFVAKQSPRVQGRLNVSCALRPVPLHDTSFLESGRSSRSGTGGSRANSMRGALTNLADLGHGDTDAPAGPSSRSPGRGRLARAFGARSGGTKSRLDVRSLAIIRETLARHSRPRRFRVRHAGPRHGAGDRCSARRRSARRG